MSMHLLRQRTQNGQIEAVPASPEVAAKWAARRASWRAEKARAGTDWRGILLFRRAVFDAVIARARRAAPVDQYDGLSSTFAAACRAADWEAKPRSDPDRIPIIAHHGVSSAARLQAEHEQAIARRRERYGPAASTLMTLDYLLKEDDQQKLQDFITEHPPSEAKEIIAYAKGRKQCL